MDLEQSFYVAESVLHGYGLFAKIPIAAGSYLGEYEGPERTENGMHVLWVEETPGNWIGRDGDNILRYLNHSVQPNTEFDGFKLYALFDIAAEEELTFDYGEEP